eukprot:TRINITY_DN321_c0_g1_i1.p1 TRINITY_DN321_c0_g1~~TRINITY_DN321_c0_g1_i1.p1  ORF type:complete len:50 (-),score=1.91 TRINITY_DN321_c0_g1_i1:203-352(-)
MVKIDINDIIFNGPNIFWLVAFLLLVHVLVVGYWIFGLAGEIDKDKKNN